VGSRVVVFVLVAVTALIVALSYWRYSRLQAQPVLTMGGLLPHAADVVTETSGRESGANVTFRLPETRTPDAWLSLIARMNGGWEKMPNGDWREHIGCSPSEYGVLRYNGGTTYEMNNAVDGCSD